MLLPFLLTFTALLAALHLSPVTADRAITAPANQSTISGGNVEFRWYSDDESDGQRFDVALMSLTPLGEYTVGADRLVSESVTLPANLPEGEYYLAINEIDDNDTDGDDRGIDDYDVRFSYEGRAPGARSRPTILTITTALSSARKRSPSQAIPFPPARRQQGTTTDTNTNDDEILYSPTNSSVAGGSSFNFTYRADDDETDRVLVGLLRAYTGLQGSAQPTSTNERTVFEGTIAVPDGIVPGEYYLAVFSDDSDETVEVGEYDLSFSTNAQLQGDDVQITGDERPIVVTVDNPNYTGGAVSPSGSTSGTAPASGAASSTGATQSASSPTAGGGMVSQSSAAATQQAAPSNAARVGVRGGMMGGVVGAVVAWAFL